MYSWYITGVCLLHNDVIRQKHIDRCVFFIIPLGFGLTMVKKKNRMSWEKLQLVLFQLDIEIVP